MRAKTTLLNTLGVAIMALSLAACKKSAPPTVTISNNISVTQTSANVTGEVTNEGSSSVTERGFIYGKQGESRQDTMYCGSGMGEFPTRLTGLEPNTTYNCSAFAKNDGGIGTSGKVTFTTRDYNVASVMTGEVENVGTTTATCGGNAMDDGGTDITERGVCWATSHTPTVNGSHASAGDGLGEFTCNITGLNAHTTYYVRAYATNSKGTAYGEEVSFNTSANPPTVSTGGVTHITSSTATGNGNVTDDGGSNVSERGICWSTSHNPTISGSHANSGTGTGEFTVNITNLTPNTTYYVRAYAINSQGTAYGEEVNFKTSQTSTYTVGVSANPANGGTVTGGGTYEQGQPCTVLATAATGYIFQKWTENGTQVSTNANYTFTVTSNRSLVAHFTAQPQVPTGAINGKFSVSAGQRVYFSQGNLQYKASTAQWRFATNQYDYIGNANSNISSSYSGWIDLFGWGTSGWNPGNTYYRPWVSFNFNGSFYGPPGQYNLTGSYAHSDWGVHNAISNGGNTAGQWRTLTQSEWDYVFNSRSTTSGIRYAKAQVAGVNGVILLPDDWNTSYYSLSSTNQSGASFTSNVIGTSAWTNNLQSHGAVFLPAAGYRNGTSVFNVGSDCRYWSASYHNSSIAWSVYFYDGNLSTYGWNDRYIGLSVRLVCPAE